MSTGKPQLFRTGARCFEIVFTYLGDGLDPAIRLRRKGHVTPEAQMPNTDYFGFAQVIA